MENEIIQRFINNVRFLCEKDGIGIGTLETSIGVTPGYLSRFKKGAKKMSLTNAYGISKVLNIPLQDLLEKDYIAIYSKEILTMELKKLEQRAAEIRSLLTEQ